MATDAKLTRNPEPGRDAAAELIHLCPPGDEAVMPCCGLSPFEVPRWHRMTLNPKKVTCVGV